MEGQNGSRQLFHRALRVKAGRLPLVTAAAIMILFLVPATAVAYNAYFNTFASTYPSSTSDNNASCGLCHNGSDTNAFNAYGHAVQAAAVPPTATSLHSIDAVNSDGDAGGYTNLQEINANAQPGWKPGATNTLWDVQTGDVITTTARPPKRLTGAIDPAADTTPPDTIIDSGPSGTVPSTDASFTFSSTEGGSTFECKLDSVGWAGCASPKNYTGLAEGSHTFEVRATDAATNVDPTPASRTWTISSAPTPAATSLTIKAPTKVAKGAKAKITGALVSTDSSCSDAQTVTLKKGSTTVGTKQTAIGGAYKFVLKIKKKTTLQVTYAGSATCGASASAKKTIKVK